MQMPFTVPHITGKRKINYSLDFHFSFMKSQLYIVYRWRWIGIISIMIDRYMICIISDKNKHENFLIKIIIDNNLYEKN